MPRQSDSARERNQRVREQQARLSEERRQRSLRSEDFTFGDEGSGFTESRSSVRRDDRVQFHRIDPENEPAAAPEEPTSRRKRRKRVRARTDASASSRGFIQTVLGASHESDFAIICCIVLLCFIGLVMIGSSSYYYAYNNIGNPLYFLKRQGMTLLLSTGFLIIAMFIPLNFVKRISWLIYLGAIGCAVAVLLFGSNLNGSTRWLQIGPISFQPAELVKLAVALFLAVKTEQYQEEIQSGKTFLKLLGFLAVPTLLVAYENLTSGIIIGLIGVTIMLIGGCRIRYFIILGILAIAILGAVIVLPLYVPIEQFPKFLQGFLEKFMYRTNRVKAYLDPFKYAQNEGYQIVQSLYAIGSGGFFGQGLGESIQKLGFIPEAYNDIIFAIICDELGLVGAGLVITLFAILIVQGSKIAIHAPDPFTTYLAVGLVVQVGLQAILNMAVATNSIPATGVSLPFISYGGTSIVFLMTGMGLLLGISRYTRQEA